MCGNITSKLVKEVYGSGIGLHGSDSGLGALARFAKTAIN
jgi:hypothetical protein